MRGIDSHINRAGQADSNDSQTFRTDTKGGAPEHPGWYRNILANPAVAIQVATTTMPAMARTATGEERARLWEQAVQIWPPFADYQRKADGREIPVVVLEPVR